MSEEGLRQLAAAVKEDRQQRGYGSQKALAAAAACHARTIGKLERCYREGLPEEEILWRVENALGWPRGQAVAIADGTWRPPDDPDLTAVVALWPRAGRQLRRAVRAQLEAGLGIPPRR